MEGLKVTKGIEHRAEDQQELAAYSMMALHCIHTLKDIILPTLRSNPQCTQGSKKETGILLKALQAFTNKYTMSHFLNPVIKKQYQDQERMWKQFEGALQAQRTFERIKHRTPILIAESIQKLCLVSPFEIDKVAMAIEDSTYMENHYLNDQDLDWSSAKDIVIKRLIKRTPNAILIQDTDDRIEWCIGATTIRLEHDGKDLWFSQRNFYGEGEDQVEELLISLHVNIFPGATLIGICHTLSYLLYEDPNKVSEELVESAEN